MHDETRRTHRNHHGSILRHANTHDRLMISAKSYRPITLSHPFDRLRRLAGACVDRPKRARRAVRLRLRRQRGTRAAASRQIASRVEPAFAPVAGFRTAFIDDALRRQRPRPGLAGEVRPAARAWIRRASVAPSVLRLPAGSGAPAHMAARLECMQMTTPRTSPPERVSMRFSNPK
jgi:hypothetical protein